MKRLVEKTISKIKHEPYQLDPAMTSTDLAIILKDKGFQVLRGFWKGLFFGKKKGIAFIGKRVKIRHARHISAEGGLTIGDNVYINALSKDGITLGDNVSIGAGSIIECTGVIRELGDGVRIGSHVQSCGRRNVRFYFGSKRIRTPSRKIKKDLYRLWFPDRLRP